jgi:hypothetical protein
MMIFFLLKDLANGQYDILFYPTMAIPHKLDIKYNGLPVTTSPMEAKVLYFITFITSTNLVHSLFFLCIKILMLLINRFAILISAKK